MIDEARVNRLYRRAGADRWQLPPEAFRAALVASVRRSFGSASPEGRELDRYLDALHVEDLALAGACALGHEGAWEYFILQYRPALYRAAAAIDRTDSSRDLADSLYAELFGARGEGPERRSLFGYFHGRSSLATWLRAILAQRHVDRVRQDRRLEPLADGDALAGAVAPDPDRRRQAALISTALSAAMNRLPAGDRLRLRAYYQQGLTLAEIGRITGEHEATVSRRLARLRRMLRVEIEQDLRGQGLADGEVRDCWGAVLDDPGAFDLGAALHPLDSPQEPHLQENGARPFKRVT